MFCEFKPICEGVADKVRVEFFCEMDQMKDEKLGYFDPRPWHQDRPQRP